MQLTFLLLTRYKDELLNTLFLRDPTNYRRFTGKVVAEIKSEENRNILKQILSALRGDDDYQSLFGHRIRLSKPDVFFSS